MEDTQPAARWASTADFDPTQMDCITFMALRILDGICNMQPAEQVMALAAYDAVRSRPGRLFDAAIHQTIEAARQYPTLKLLDEIHALRMRAEARIPSPVMNQFRARLRRALFK